MVGSVLVHLLLALSISFPFRINHEREISFHLHHKAEVLLWYYVESSTRNVGCRENWWFHNDLIYRRDVNSEDESEEEPDPGLFQGCSENKLGQENRTSRCRILIDLNGPFVNCHSTVSPDFYFTWVLQAVILPICKIILALVSDKSFASSVSRILLETEASMYMYPDSQHKLTFLFSQDLFCPTKGSLFYLLSGCLIFLKCCIITDPQIPFISDLNASENKPMDIQMRKAEKVALANKHWVKQNFVSIFKVYEHGEGTHVPRKKCEVQL